MKALLLAGLALACAMPAAAARVLRLSANTWEPYTGADLPRQGIASEIVTTALARAGYTAEIGFMPWSRALASAYGGQRDGVLTVWSTAERRGRLLYSDSYLSNELYFFAAQAQRCPDAATTLSALRIGVGRDYDYSDAFLVRYGQAIKPVDTLKQNLLKLAMGRIDVMLEDRRAVDYLLRQQAGEFGGAPAPHRCTQQPLLSLPLYLGINRDAPDAAQIIQAFNAQLKAMKKDGTLEAIVRRLQTRFQP